MFKILSKIKQIIKSILSRPEKRKAQKVFCIGNNKTGTTSLEKAMVDLGFKAGNQLEAELLHNEWAKRNFSPFFELCERADFLQDFPFSKPFTYIAMDQRFRNSKFILTVRDSPEQWYHSVVSFHSKLWGKDSRVPVKEDLQNAEYIYKGWAWNTNRELRNTPETDLYNKEMLIDSYITHNEQVMEYFRHRQHDLLVLNVSEKNAYRKLCDFLDIETDKNDFPWLNKTADIS